MPELSLCLQPLRPLYVSSLIQFLTWTQGFYLTHSSFCWCVFSNVTCLIFTAHVKLSSQYRSIHLLMGELFISLLPLFNIHHWGICLFTNNNESTFMESLWDDICDRQELKELRWREIKIKGTHKFLMGSLRQLGPSSSEYFGTLQQSLSEKFYRKVLVWNLLI